MVDPVRFVTDTVHHSFRPVHWSTVAHVPETYVLDTRGRPIPPEMQEEMIDRLPLVATVVRLDCGDVPPATEPERFAAALKSVVAML